MSSLWGVVAGLVLVASVLVALAARRVRDDVTPTIEAFAEFRAALRPELAALRVEVTETRERITRADARIRTGHG